MKQTRFGLLVIVGLVLAFTVAFPKATARAADLSAVDIVVQTCAASTNAPKAPDLEVFDVVRGGTVDVPIDFRKANPELGMLAFKIAPGFYNVLFSIGGCSKSVDVAVLLGSTRHVFMHLSTGAPLGLQHHGMIAGRLPFAGMNVEVLACMLSCDVPSNFIAQWTVVDGDAYYATNLPSGHLIVRLSLGASFESKDIPVEVRPDGLSRHLNVVRDISIRDIFPDMQSP